MRILWIGKRPSDGAAGDEIFDRKTIAACRGRGHDIDLFHPTQVSRPAELANLLSLVPHYRTRFASAANRQAIAGLSGAYDAVICSWEPLDTLARGIAPPSLMILHNVTSRALPALFPGNPVVGLAARRARAWERTTYRPSNFAAIAALSRRDLDYLKTLPDAPQLLLLPPGMPPCQPLDPAATLVPELVISGTFDWVPKRRDVLRFAEEYATSNSTLPIRAETLPPQAMQRLRPRPLPSIAEAGAHLRFGLITDRFEAGHKLKTMAYIANNQIVLTFADVAFDFSHVPDHAWFIRRVSSIAELALHVRSVAALPTAELRARFLAFQQTCAQSLTWDHVAATLLDAIEHPSQRRHAA